MASTELDLDLGRYKLGWSDAEDYVSCLVRLERDRSANRTTRASF